MMHGLKRFVPALAILVIVVVLPFTVLGSGYHYRLATLVWTASITVIGLNLLVGFAGQVSLGHAAFGGIAGYATAILPAQFGLDPLTSFVLGVAGAGVLAAIVGKPILRLKGHYLAIATLGLGFLVAMVLTNEVAITGGPDGIAVPRAQILGFRVAGSELWYWIAGLVTVLAALLAGNLVDSPAGRALRAIHDSEIAAKVVGVDVAKAKLKVFVLSAVFAGVGGGLLSLSSGFATPSIASFLHSVELVTMVVLGGMGSIFGSVVGAAILVLLPQLLVVFQDYENLMLGLVMILVMVFLRRGIVPSIAELFARRRA